MLLLVGVFLALLFLGMPVAFAIGLSGFVFMLATPNIPLSIVVQRIVSQTQSFTLLAIPLFIMVGGMMDRGGIGTSLVNFVDVFVGPRHDERMTDLAQARVGRAGDGDRPGVAVLFGVERARGDGAGADSGEGGHDDRSSRRVGWVLRIQLRPQVICNQSKAVLTHARSGFGRSVSRVWAGGGRAGGAVLLDAPRAWRECGREVAENFVDTRSGHL